MKRKPNGFSLIEILVALSILTIGILVVSQMVTTGIQISAEEHQRMYARVVMSRIFEFLRDLPQSDAFLQDDGDPDDLNDTSSSADFSITYTDSTANYSYLLRWNIADNIPETSIKTVRIHILWGPTYNKKITTDLMKAML
jgi:prepilin-type N-terminal cleavage/methylation domain-containing protein